MTKTLTSAEAEPEVVPEPQVAADAPAPEAPPQPAAAVVMPPQVAADALVFLRRGMIPVLVQEAEALLTVRMTLEAIANSGGAPRG